MTGPVPDAPTREQLREAITWIREGHGNLVGQRYLAPLAELAARQLLLIEFAERGPAIDQAPRERRP